jgi:hypothetical protein
VQVYQEDDKAFFTDRQLQARWSVSHMTLYRLRVEGKLPAPIKLGGVGKNLTAAEHVYRLEQPQITDEEAA